ncbi:hypothetical protein C8R45DRAFT_938018 [Mycena sanguinolenta]|nr:hypothetical protein C8R45DRAFT_938018 [Mycena sanguinolenta]
MLAQDRIFLLVLLLCDRADFVIFDFSLLSTQIIMRGVSDLYSSATRSSKFRQVPPPQSRPHPPSASTPPPMCPCRAATCLVAQRARDECCDCHRRASRTTTAIATWEARWRASRRCAGLGGESRELGRVTMDMGILVNISTCSHSRLAAHESSAWYRGRRTENASLQGGHRAGLSSVTERSSALLGRSDFASYYYLASLFLPLVAPQTSLVSISCPCFDFQPSAMCSNHPKRRTPYARLPHTQRCCYSALCFFDDVVSCSGGTSSRGAGCCGSTLGTVGMSDAWLAGAQVCAEGDATVRGKLPSVRERERKAERAHKQDHAAPGDRTERVGQRIGRTRETARFPRASLRLLPSISGCVHPAALAPPRGTARRARRRRRGQASDTNTRSGPPPTASSSSIRYCACVLLRELYYVPCFFTGVYPSLLCAARHLPPRSLRPPLHLPRFAPSPSMRLWSSFASYQSQLRAFPRTLRAGLYGRVPLLTLRWLRGGLEFFLLARYDNAPKARDPWPLLPQSDLRAAFPPTRAPIIITTSGKTRTRLPAFVFASAVAVARVVVGRAPVDGEERWGELHIYHDACIPSIEKTDPRAFGKSHRLMLINQLESAPVEQDENRFHTNAAASVEFTTDKSDAGYRNL